MSLASLYCPLSELLDEFRLLHITPDSSSSPLECTLKTVPLGQFSRHKEGIYDWTNGKTLENDWKPEESDHPIRWVPTFEALSYTWGDPKSTDKVKVNGQLVDVTTNLKKALLALRKHDKERIMWIDAICINQKDIQEKNDQIRRMPGIYQRAFQTISWLGEEDPHALRAMSILERMGGTKEHLDKLELPKPLMWCGPQFDDCYDVGTEIERDIFEMKLDHARKQDLIDVTDLNDQDWEALEIFFNSDHRPYWTRLWIIQEIANSQNVIFQCGPQQMHWAVFYFPRQRASTAKETESIETSLQNLTLNHQTHYVLSLRFRKIVQSGMLLVNQRDEARRWSRSLGFENQASSLLTLLQRFRGYHCTDPRDRIYALLGLPSIDKTMPLPKPDYAKPLAQVYCEIAKAIIRHTADLTILSIPSILSEIRTDLQIPSWVPDWLSTSDEQAIFWDPHELTDGNIFKAAGDTLPEGPEFHFPPDQDGKQRQKARPTMHSHNYMIKVGNDFRGTGLVSYPVYDGDDQYDYRLLDLKGCLVDNIMDLSSRIPDHAFENHTWKQELIEWEKLIRAFRVFGQWGDRIEEIDPGLRHPKLPQFIQAIFKGKLFTKANYSVNELEKLFVEHYLVWTGRIEPDKSKVPIDSDLFQIFDNELAKSVHGWKLAITEKGRVALVPGMTTTKDAVVILLGSDYPLVLQPVLRMPYAGELRVCWMLKGAAFVCDIMGGDVINDNAKRDSQKEGFLLM